MIDKIKEIEEKHNITVLYMCLSGSKLYGTDNKNSDSDYKFIFMPKIDDILLGKHKEHFRLGVSTKTKNTKDDIDLDGVSVHNFLQLLRKGETGALDILFSFFSPSVVYENEIFAALIKKYYKDFLNRKLHSFVGYSVGQSKKYGIKGTRYKELTKFNKLELNNSSDKLGSLFDKFVDYFNENETKYLKMTKAPGPKTLKEPKDIDYVEILGKKFSGDVTISYFYDKVTAMEEQFGNRTKASGEGTDWKALSHSVRVLLEVEELLKDGFITFPLKEKEYVKQVKENKINIECVMDFINNKLDEVSVLLENSALPEKSNTILMDDIELSLIKLYGV